MTRSDALSLLLDRPVKFAHMLGFTKLGDIHNEWIRNMVRGKEDITLQASRGTYKTTCVSFALVIIIICLPRKKTLFMRKTDPDVKEVINQVRKILTDPHTIYIVQCIYGVKLALTVDNASEINTNLAIDIRGTNQLVGMGIGSSITGKHFEFIFTDDIVNVFDRTSRAERERTKLMYQELQNIKNRDGGRFINTGTPWHGEDAFSLMPNIQRYDCYDPAINKIIGAEELERIRSKMLPSLFAANYELRIVASEDVIFTNPQTGGDPAMVEQGLFHVDAAYQGEDFTAWGAMNKIGDKYYLYGKMKRKHIEECYEEIVADYERFMCGKSYTEDNEDKGFSAKELRRRGLKVVTYHENMNKYLKIVTYLKAIWADLIFVEGTDPAYINQICDYFEDAEHDDAADNASSLARIFYKKRNRNADGQNLSIWS